MELGGIKESAIVSDLTGGAGEWTYIPHLDHGFDKVGEEKRGVRAISLDQGFCSGGLRLSSIVGVGEQNLVGAQEALPVEQVFEVMVVE